MTPDMRVVMKATAISGFGLGVFEFGRVSGKWEMGATVLAYVNDLSIEHDKLVAFGQYMEIITPTHAAFLWWGLVLISVINYILLEEDGRRDGR